MADTIISQLEPLVSGPDGWSAALDRILEHFSADSGTIHLLGADGVLHLAAASAGIPPPVIEAVRLVPIGKGMAGLAVERNEPITACNLQTDSSGNVRSGARATGMQGSIVVPILDQGKPVGALGIANRRERTFTEAETTALMDIGRLLGSRHAGLALD